MAAEDDEIARLLREVDAMTGNAPTQPSGKDGSGSRGEAAARPTGKEVAKTDEGAGAGARTRWALIAAAGGGAVGLVVGTFLGFLPFVDGLTTAVGAAGGAALAGLVGGPPRWLR